MIVTAVEPASHWTCLARRGMLFSETEAIEYWVLAPDEHFHLGQTPGIDEMLIVLSGCILLGSKAYKDGAVILAPNGRQQTVLALHTTTLLSVRVLPDEITAILPIRRPELPENVRVF